MKRIVLNGLATQVTGGRLIDSLRAAGHGIPSLCDRPDVDPSCPRGCRVCLCEVDGSLVPSCTAEVQDGMSVQTGGARVDAGRQCALWCHQIAHEGGDDGDVRPAFMDAIPVLKSPVKAPSPPSPPPAGFRTSEDRAVYQLNVLHELLDKAGVVNKAVVLRDAEEQLGGLSKFMQDLLRGGLESYVGDHVAPCLTHYPYFASPAPDGETPASTVFVCECANCVARGANDVMAQLTERKIPFLTTPWLGWCVAGAPAALVRHRGDGDVHAMFNLRADALVLDERLASPEALRAFKNPVASAPIVTRTAKRLAQTVGRTPISALENIPLSGDDQQWLAANHQCPVSRKAYEMTPKELIAALGMEALLEPVRAVDSGAKTVVINADECGSLGAFGAYALLSHPFARIRIMNGMGAIAHAVGATRAVLYLGYPYKNLKEPLLKAFDTYKGLNKKLALEAFDVVVGAGAPLCSTEPTALLRSIGDQTPHPIADPCGAPPSVVIDAVTLAWCAPKLYAGLDAWKAAGVNGATGMALFSASGSGVIPTVAEFPNGTPSRTILEDILGEADVSTVGAVEVGGAAGVVALPDRFDDTVVVDSGAAFVPCKRGVIQSRNGSLVVHAKTAYDPRAVFAAKAKFFNLGGCQLCGACDDGTHVFRNTVGAIMDGSVTDTQRPLLDGVFADMEEMSLCGHGKACAKLARTLLQEHSAATR